MSQSQFKNQNAPKFPGLIRIPESRPVRRQSNSASSPAPVESSSDPHEQEGSSGQSGTTANTQGNKPVRTRGPSLFLQQLDKEIAEYVESPALVPSGFSENIWPGINMSDIARATGMTVGGVSRIFNGKRKARRHTLISIANLYTEGDVAAVEAVIEKRIHSRLKRETGKGQMSQDERNRLIQRVS